MSKFTKEDNDQIEFAKQVITKSFAAMNISRPAGLIALTELIVSTLCQGPKNTKELEEIATDWYEKCFKEVLTIMGQRIIDSYAKLMKMEKEHPGALDALTQASLNNPNDGIQIRVGNELAPYDIPGPTTNTTKH